MQEMQRTGSKTPVLLKTITGIIIMQMTAKAGIKKHSQLVMDTLFEEFFQLHDLGVFLAQDPKNLTRAQKKAALRGINVIKEKRCGRIKGRTVADRRNQINLYRKEETSSPPVSNDALMFINGKQCTITWFVDDTKITHVDTKVVTEAIEKIESKVGKMIVTRGGKNHVFLGMGIRFQKNSTL